MQNKLPHNLKALRKKLSLTQQDLATQSKVNYSTLIKIERGEIVHPSIETLSKLAKALNVDVTDLMRGTNTLPIQATEGLRFPPFDQLYPEEFEEISYKLIKRKYPETDYNVTHWGGSGDGGKDIKVLSTQTGKVIYVQCKRVVTLTKKHVIDTIEAIKAEYKII
jgi:transcriptional regulator with XRE-family HTH domain